MTGSATPGGPREARPAPTVSVVIPAFNAAAHIAATIRSVVAQASPPLEIVVVDDGSTDDTARVAREASPLVKCLTQANAGVAAARNAGIRAATGSHVAFLDADDRWDDRHLSDALEALARLPVRWCAGAYRVQKANGRLFDVTLPGTRHSEEPVLVRDYFAACARKWRVWTSACVVERALLLEHGGFDPELRIGEDIDLWFRIALDEPSLGYCPVVSVVYRNEADSLMHLSENTGQGWYDDVLRMESQAREKGPDALRRARPLLSRHADAAARLAGRLSDRELARRLLGRHGGLLRPTTWVRLALSLALPARANRLLWSLRAVRGRRSTD